MTVNPLADLVHMTYSLTETSARRLMDEPAPASNPEKPEEPPSSECFETHMADTRRYAFAFSTFSLAKFADHLEKVGHFTAAREARHLVALHQQTLRTGRP
ncbi:hypothetical protein [Prauserella muralis]|uniref:Uncharacterized protein n=1 Tax=Prauserella muralis TaxID=588067 RepID=A0A2V4ALJ5_9PSEU|nr:hypothetical protein [Prauserella muralis]PXY20863.1 hypothetical protein BAY60_25500 [Prauserella muralis]TWE29902.1 hypothetical protein FHX69_2594 [Prauserella muralis]